uniref:Uncharacterized protein n=1 Tax=Lactuca sativa TaxID=4236 RepID=A0A9R1UJN7_LACSA|nr:hypothetical protein LSAT_V11C900483190 [Lactuca sativa]
MVEHSVKSFHNSPFPNRSIGMTQEFVDIISNSPLKDIMKTPKDHCLSPLPLSIVPIHSDYVVVRARDLRPRNNPVLRSLFIVRAVDITKLVREFHIFLVVLDFQQPAFWIIDNIKRDEDTQHTYGLLPDIITFMGGKIRDFKIGFKLESLA